MIMAAVHGMLEQHNNQMPSKTLTHLICLAKSSQPQHQKSACEGNNGKEEQ